MNHCLPVTLPPLPGELLSSCISRHAEFYCVTPLTMLRHCLSESASLRAIDLMLSIDQANTMAEMFSIGSKAVRGMSFAESPKTTHRFIAKTPVHHCAHCSPTEPGTSPILRSELQGWRITCPFCRQLYQDKATSGDGPASTTYRAAARRDEKLLNDHAERGVETWFFPLEITQLLLMRRVPWPIPCNRDLWRYRILGTVIPDLDAILAKHKSVPYSPKHPILPLHLRPALLAGVAIIERAGPAMLKMLQAHMLGENKTRFIKATDHLVSPAFESGPPQQLQLI
ncbi:TniQ family protein [Celeribacter baekdonensis]|uniref:TniQ family protein n=1 Tax=Celeribacter baekdonensis TaxID=875171 RepID=UPI0030DB8FD7|tara:strand:+ start:70580 stop:71431 length:852 start_codon:yes stop_codon:yes gene_type:complete